LEIALRRPRKSIKTQPRKEIRVDIKEYHHSRKSRIRNCAADGLLIGGF
jgi:hypothetical protein